MSRYRGSIAPPISCLPPYHDETFLATIRHYYENSHSNIAVMTVKEWYTVLLEDNVLMSPARCEMLHPTLSWQL